MEPDAVPWQQGWPSHCGRPQTAQARLFCLSLRFHQASDANGFSTLDLSSTGNLDAPNGELAPTFNTPDESFSFFRLYDTIFDEIVQEVRKSDPQKATILEKGFADLRRAPGNRSATARELLKKL